MQQENIDKLIRTVETQSKTIERLTILVEACLKSLSEIIGESEK